MHLINFGFAIRLIYLCQYLFIFINAECEIFVTDYQVKCSNMTLQEGDVLDKPGNGTITFLFLENVGGVIDNTTLQNYPQLTGLTISSSTVRNKNSIRNLPTIGAIEFRECNLPKITKDFLKSCCGQTRLLEFTRIPNLEFEDNALAAVNDYLQELTIDGAIEINSNLFKGVTNLGNLFLIRTNLKRLTKDLISNMKKLWSLSIVNSGLEQIDEDTFIENPKILFFWASSNNISEIKPNTFKNLKKLEFLNLMGNSIQDFNIDLLSEQKELKILRLDTKNMLKMKPLEMRQAFPKLQQIGLCMEHRFKPEISEFVANLNVSVSWRDDDDKYVEF